MTTRKSSPVLLPGFVLRREKLRAQLLLFDDTQAQALENEEQADAMMMVFIYNI